MALLNKTARYSRHTYGDDGNYGKRNILSVSFVASELRRPATAGAATVLAASASDITATTYTTGITNPDVPRNITVTGGGTAADIKTGNVVVTGTNVEGKVITENFAFTDNTAATVTGNKAFKTVTSILIPIQDGTGATYSVGYGVKLGIGLRNIASMPAKVFTKTAAGVEAIEDASATAFSTTAVESNTVTTTTAPDGTIEFRVYVLNYKYALNPTNGNPDYGV